MNNLLQLIWGNNGNGRVGILVRRIVLVIIILVAAQAIIGVVAMLVSSCVQGLTNFVMDSINSISYGFTGGDRVESLTRLCLWLLTVIIILKILVNRKDHYMANQNHTYKGAKDFQPSQGYVKKRLFTLKQAVEYLGLSDWGMRTLFFCEIPVVNINGGRKNFLDINNLNAFIERNEVRA